MKKAERICYLRERHGGSGEFNNEHLSSIVIISKSHFEHVGDKRVNVLASIQQEIIIKEHTCGLRAL